MSPSSLWSGRTAVLLVALVAVLALLGWALAWAIRNDAVVLLVQANQWIADTVIKRMGYAGVFLLMALESSVVPVPAELVMPPAGDLAQRLPDWNLGGVIAAGTAGSLAGALISYWLAKAVGLPLVRALIRRYGKFVHISLSTFDQTEDLVQKHGAISTFVGRLLPGIRHLISIPAGLGDMNLVAFSILTVAGAGLWNTILAYLGYGFGQDPQRLSAAMKQYSHWVVAGALGVIACYVAWMWLRSRAGKAAASRVEGG